ncbi:hypothetical protein [Afifella sp. IM 167]|uniref:hypothetical protein n=1 Tax=Afifella sp. IM 167 TaxID=2033586 RepID=UPI001CC8F516|nr:hypothetical protein [Afifella sp. IM 167]MBZ8133259.1 hypothetical protein [Afifella sp. IM 167]
MGEMCRGADKSFSLLPKVPKAERAMKRRHAADLEPHVYFFDPLRSLAVSLIAGRIFGLGDGRPLNRRASTAGLSLPGRASDGADSAEDDPRRLVKARRRQDVARRRMLRAKGRVL